MSEPIINDIDVSEYFINHYDNKGKLYAVEYKGNPLGLQNAIKCLQEENEELKQERLEVSRLFDKTCRCDDLQEDTAKCQYLNDDCISIRHCMKKFRSLKDSYKQALEEIREIAKFNQFYNPKYFMLRGDIGQIQNIKMTEIYEKCNEVLNDRD